MTWKPKSVSTTWLDARSFLLPAVATTMQFMGREAIPLAV
jgi:hypothetical protein